MKSIVLCFNVDLPERLRPVKFRDRGVEYFESPAAAADRKLQTQQWLDQTNRAIIDLIRRSADKFCLALHITGRMLETLSNEMTSALESFKALLRTGQVELTGGPYYQSLTSLHSPSEFSTQVRQHADALQAAFGSRPLLLLNTGLIYMNDLVDWVTELGFQGVVSPVGETDRDPQRGVRRFGTRGHRRARRLIANLAASQRLNAELSGRASVRWPGASAASGQRSMFAPNQPQFILGDYRLLSGNGNSNGSQAGLSFLARWVGQVVADSHQAFQLPSEACSNSLDVEVDVPTAVDGFSEHHDLDLWYGNAIQQDAARQLYDLRDPVLHGEDEGAIRDWRRLTAENHLRAMHTDTPAVQAGGTSPYDTYIRFMNVLDDLRRRIG